VSSSVLCLPRRSPATAGRRRDLRCAAYRFFRFPDFVIDCFLIRPITLRKCVASADARVENGRVRCIAEAGARAGKAVARCWSLGSTQSIGIEWQFSVGQCRRSGPCWRVPPTTSISRPDSRRPQTKQNRLSWSELHDRQRSSCRSTFNLSSAESLMGSCVLIVPLSI
jgi:hypothetical protein